MTTEEWIIRWLARIVVALYFLRLLNDINSGVRTDESLSSSASRLNRERLVQWSWTLAFGLHVLHIVLAFAWIHHWDHAHAYEVTAQRTAAVVGWKWGGGIWINHLFLLWWINDMRLTWRYGLYQLSPNYVIQVHAVVMFFVFNATVVFGPRWWIPVFVLAMVVVGGWKLRGRKPSKTVTEDQS